MKRILLTILVSGALLPLGLRAQTNDALGMAKAHLSKKHPQLVHQKSLDWVVTDEVYSKHNGVTHLYLRQTFNGIEIINSNMNVALKEGKVIHSAGKVLDNLVAAAASSAGLSAEEAVRASARHLGIADGTLQRQTNARTGAAQFISKEISQEPIPVKQVYWFDESSNSLQMAYDLNVFPKGQKDWWSMRIDAQTGQVLEKNSWTLECSFDQPHVHTTVSKGLTHSASTENHTLFSGEQYNVFAWPIESPNHGDQSLQVAPFSATASPFGWHDTNGATGAEFTITRGNNVHAYEDALANNFAGYSPNGGAELDFNFGFVDDGEPTNSRDASITNLFYWNNIIHDILYAYGFDEPAGNFQQNNYGKGGTAGDYVAAEDEDGSGLNNANFATPPDGQRPRMQMYLWANGGNFELEITSPSEIAGTYIASTANFGPSLVRQMLSGDLVLVDDGTATPTLGCSAILNGSELSGKIAVIDRGSCNFTVKVKNAQNAGAKAVLVLSNANGTEFGPEPGTMGGEDATITIPSIMINLSDANILRPYLETGVTGQMQDGRSYVSSSFDNGIIVHEYGHGVSNRLTGGPSNASCLFNEEQMGEGWSDYLGLMLTIQEDPTATTARGIGTFAAGQVITGRGIRPAPYSYDMTVNPFTYGDVADPGISVPHGVGFIWCTMLWDMTWLLIQEHGFDPDIYNGTGGNNIALQLVMDGMKLQACSPGFIDGRDAILLADRINNNGENQDLIWEAFRRRGLGYNASQGFSSSRSDGEEDFSLPPTLTFDVQSSKVLSMIGETLEIKVNLSNTFASILNNVEVQATLPQNIAVVEESLQGNISHQDGIVTIFIDEFGSLNEEYQFSAVVTDATSVTSTTFLDDQEGDNNNWTIQGGGWQKSGSNPASGSESWFVNDPNFSSDRSLVLTVPTRPLANSKLVFWHSYNTEANFDGGIVEISTNGGSSWVDLGSRMFENGYNSSIPNSDQTSTQLAFSGPSGGYVKTSVNLSSYAGDLVRIRFRFLSDQAVGGEGWYIDDVYIYTGSEVTTDIDVCATVDGTSEVCDKVTVTIYEPSVVLSTEEGLQGVTVYPNPTKESINVSIANQRGQKTQLSLIDLNGRIIRSASLDVQNDKFVETVNLRGLPDGVYLLDIQSGDKKTTKRIVLTR